MRQSNKGKINLRRRAEKRLAAERSQKPPSQNGGTKTVRDMELSEAELQLQTRDLLKNQEELRSHVKELRDAKCLLEKTRDRYIELYDSVPAACFTVEVKTNRIIEVNLSACDMLKGDRNHILRDRFNRLVEPEFADSFQIAAGKALEAASGQTCEISMRRCDGSCFWALVQIRGVPKTGLVRIAATDITEFKKNEQMKDDFIGMVSHELRTPLTVILGAIKVAEEKGISSKERKELLADAVQSAEELWLILENLIELSRHRADHTTLDKNTLNLEDFLQHIAASESRHLSDHRFRLESNGYLPEIQADKVKLQQILYNLLDNAAKYSPEKTEIRLIVRKRDDGVLIGVSDKGPGISLPDQAKLFEPFERLPEKMTPKPGLGLGLVVCRHLVEAHGGKIWVDSTPGQGTTFWFTLPF